MSRTMRAPAVVAVAVVTAVVAVLATTGVQRWTAEEPERPSDRLAGLVDDGYAASLFMEQAPDGLPDDLADRMELVLAETPWSHDQARAVAAALVQAGGPATRSVDDGGPVLEAVVTAAASSGEVHPGLRAAVLEVVGLWHPTVHEALTGVVEGSPRVTLASDDVEGALQAAGADVGAAAAYADAYASWAAEGLRRTLTGIDGAQARRDALDARIDLPAGVGLVLDVLSERSCGPVEGERCLAIDDGAEDTALVRLWQAVADTTDPEELPAGLLGADGRVVRLDPAAMTPEQSQAFGELVERGNLLSAVANAVGLPDRALSDAGLG